MNKDLSEINRNDWLSSFKLRDSLIYLQFTTIGAIRVTGIESMT